MMGDSGLSVVGSRPSSSAGMHHGSVSINGQNYTSGFSPPKPSRNAVNQQTYSYADRIFGERPPSSTSQNGRPNSGRPSSGRPGSGRQTPNSYRNTKKNAFKDSYVDETLFGPKVESANFSAPWENGNNPKPAIFDYTDYKKGTRFGSGQKRPTSAKRKPIKAEHNASYVDESLFGNKVSDGDFDAPWGEKKTTSKPHLFDYGGTPTANPPGGNSSRAPTPGGSARSMTSSRPSSRSDNRPSSRTGNKGGGGGLRPPSQQSNYFLDSCHNINKKSKSRKNHHKHTPGGADETLFGPKLEEASFKAPWDKEKRAVKPVTYDYNMCLDGGRPVSRSDLNHSNKPAWK